MHRQVRIGTATVSGMQIGILGTGTLATALATAWSEAGHQLVIGGRDHAKAQALAAAVGGRAVPPREVDGDAVLLAVAWAGVEPMLDAAGELDGVALIDPVNPVEHGVGVVLASAAERIAALKPRAHVVKAFHLYPASQWTERPERVVVPICGDDGGVLEHVGALVRDAGGDPVTVGGLRRARQLEEAAGLVIALAFAGANPRSAVPSV